MWNEVNQIMTGACAGCDAASAVRQYQDAHRAYQDAVSGSTNDNYASGYTRKMAEAKARLDAACAALLAVRGVEPGTGV